MHGPLTPRWGLVALLVLAGLLAAFHAGKAPPALPAMRADLGLDLVAAGWMVSIFGVTGAGLGLVAGTLADQAGHRRLALMALAAMAAGSASGALAVEEATLLASRVVEGLGFLALQVAAPSLIVALVPGRERNIVLGFWGSTMPAGMALIIALAPLALALVGWRGLWWIAGALSLAMLAALAYATRDTAAPEEVVAEPPAPLARNVRLTVARLAPWLIFGAFALFTFQWTSVMVWLPTYLIEDKGYGLGTAALLTALVVAVNVPGNLTAGFLIHRGVSRWLMVAIAGAAMGLSVLVVFADGVGDGMRFAACLAFSYFGGLLPTATRAAVPLFAPSHAQLGTTNGLLGQGANLGQLIGPPAVAAIVAATGAWGQARWLMAAAAVGIVALALWSRAAERRALAEGR